MNYYPMSDIPPMPPLAIEFFGVFARLEFALKRGGFLAGEVDKKASADWDDFAAKLGERFFDAVKAEPRAAVFFEAPPKRLIVAAPNVPEFRDQPVLVNAQMLLEALRLVRNNLFHGEKPYVDHRDETLMKASLVVIGMVLQFAEQDDKLEPVAAAYHYAGINAH